MSLHNNTFRDYCKAENSEDEEANVDLQSRLYAEIYYASDRQEDIDSKNSVKLECSTIDNEIEQLLDNNASDLHSKNLDSNNESSPNEFTETDKKFDIIPASNRCENEDIKPHIADGESRELSCKHVELSDTNITGSPIMCHNVTSTKVVVDLPSHDLNKDLPVKSDTQSGIKDEIQHVECENIETEVTKGKQSVCLESNSSEIKENTVKASEKERDTTENEAGDNSNILNKYKFSKNFINELYMKKYKKIKKKFRSEVEEEVEMESEQSLKTQALSSTTDNTYTKYNVRDKSKKKHEEVHYYMEQTAVLSESDSDSQDSILEVPIPPKPQPPTIVVQDSDDDSTTSCDSDFNYKHKKAKTNKNNVISSQTMSVNESAAVDNVRDITAQRTEDLVIHCTQVRKGALTINEIKDMNKQVRLQATRKSPKSTPEKKKSVSINQGGEKSSRKSLEKVETNLPKPEKPKNISSCETGKKKPVVEVVREDSVGSKKNKNNNASNTVAEIASSSTSNCEQSNKSRKRHCPDEDERNRTAKQRKLSNSETSTLQESGRKEIIKDDSWDEYFFQPMPESLKTFYNESRGQENFDVSEIQSKMSKDPRLWAILDEDLMPHLSRQQRFWNAKCSHCQREGHQKYNCPEPRKLPQCHICGSQGHTETRCPQKMCLTCGKKQQTFRKTCESCRTLFCNMCKAVGHKATECPDLWRRFHQTTRNSELIIPENLTDVMKPADLLCCCNCTKRGHDSSMCREYRWSQHFQTPSYVSNYTGGPGFDGMDLAIRKGDIIPLSTKESEPNSPVPREQIVLRDRNVSEDGSYIIYKYGNFCVRNQNSREIEKDITHVIGSQLNALSKGQIVPHFLESLLQRINFEVKITFDTENNVMLSVLSFSNVTEYIFEILMHWLELPKNEKHRKIRTNFPSTTTGMANFLKSEWRSIDRGLSDPRSICQIIKKLKAKVKTIKNPSHFQLASLLKWQKRLIMVYHSKPTLSSTAMKLEDIKNEMSAIAKREITMAEYLCVLTYYNKMFMPYTLADSELEYFFLRYYKGRSIKKKTKKQKHDNPYMNFVEGLKKYNRSIAGTKQKQIPIDIVNTHKKSPKNAPQKQRKQITKSESCINSTIVDIQPDNAAKMIPQNVPLTEIPQSSNSLPGRNNIQTGVLHNQQTANTNSVIGINRTLSNSRFDSISSTRTTSKKIKFSESRLQNLHKSNSDINDVICIDDEDEKSDIEKTHKKGVANKNQPVTTVSDIKDNKGNLQATSSNKKKKKCKKQKKIKNMKSLEKEAVNYKSVAEKAEKVINDALEFRVPYMNDAAAEVQKRINDQSLKQEHIDILDKLVSLEREHQKHVTSFCTYLK